jgi:hypothetical protein
MDEKFFDDEEATGSGVESVAYTFISLVATIAAIIGACIIWIV